jgi:hypothetical protein
MSASAAADPLASPVFHTFLSEFSAGFDFKDSE